MYIAIKSVCICIKERFIIFVGKTLVVVKVLKVLDKHNALMLYYVNY